MIVVFTNKVDVTAPGSITDPDTRCRGYFSEGNYANSASSPHCTEIVRFTGDRCDPVAPLIETTAPLPPGACMDGWPPRERGSFRRLRRVAPPMR